MNKRTLDLANIQVVQNVAWLDERPQCRHLIASWRAGRDVGSRCEGYGWRNGQPEPGYCPINGGICAMEDPTWVFKPGWDRWAEWCSKGHGYIAMDVWPGFRTGDLVAYVVSGDCMAPTYRDGDVAIARLGKEGFEDGAACVIQRKVPGWGWPLEGKYLKRLERIGDGFYLITADNADFEPALVPVRTVNLVAVVQEDVDPETVSGQLTVCHVFDESGHIVPNLQAVARVAASEGNLSARQIHYAGAAGGGTGDGAVGVV